MSILAFGGEMGFFIPSDANAIEQTTQGVYDNGFARCATSAKTSSSYLTSPVVTPQTSEFWLHFDIDQEVPLSDSGFIALVQIYDQTGASRIILNSTYSVAGASTWRLNYWDGAAFQAVGDCIAPSNANQTIDIHVSGINGASGRLDLYMSGTQRIGSSVIDLSGIDDLAQASFGGRGVANTNWYSQCILANESTIGKKVGTIVMTGNGASTSFAGDYTGIDETVFSDGDEINSATANEVELYTGTPVPSFTGYTIRALAIFARAKKSGSGPAQMQLALRSAGTTYFSSTKALDFGYGAIGAVWETNPATSAAFLSSEISALQYGAKSIT